MKRNIARIITALIVLLISAGCKKYLNINKDPNHTLTVSESLLLGPIEKTVGATTVAGDCGMVATYWTQQISQNQPPPTFETYEIFPAGVNKTWSIDLYNAIFENLKIMIAQAEKAHHNHYVAIGKTLYAYNLAVATDFWNDIPYSQANNSKFAQPKYDSQESIYNAVQLLLDSAIYYANLPPGADAPSTDDFIYAGNMSEWKKFAYTLKARYYLRLSKAPGHVASSQADSALMALQNGFVDNSDNATIVYTGGANDQNPWYSGTLSQAGGVVLSKFFIDYLASNHDPRLPVLANLNSIGTYEGRPSGADPAPNYTIYSTPGFYFGGADPININNIAGATAPLNMATYSEALFIKAEAIFITQGPTEAKPVFQAAIASHMSLLNINFTNQNIYIGSRPVLTNANAIQQIISEKYIADFLSVETYNDWRRTGYPQLNLAQNAFVNYIPRRWPYPSAELLANPQPQQKATIADRVWWDVQ